MSHVSALAIEDFVMGRLADGGRFEAHVDRCVRCARRLAGAARDELSLRALAREQRCGTAAEVGSRLPAPGSRNGVDPQVQGEGPSAGSKRPGLPRDASRPLTPPLSPTLRGEGGSRRWLAAAAVVVALAAAILSFAGAAGLSAALPAHAEAPAGGLALDGGVPEPFFLPPGALARVDGG